MGLAGQACKSLSHDIAFVHPRKPVDRSYFIGNKMAFTTLALLLYREFINGRGMKGVSGVQNGPWECRLIGRIRIMLCFQYNATVLGIYIPVSAVQCAVEEIA